jgi:hypothetical protein
MSAGTPLSGYSVRLQTNGKDNLERKRVAMSVFSGTDQNLRFMIPANRGHSDLVSHSASGSFLTTRTKKAPVRAFAQATAAPPRCRCGDADWSPRASWSCIIRASALRVPPLGCPRGCRPAALENHSPGTSEALERPFELILDEFSCEVLEAYRTSKCTVWPNGAVDVSCIGAESCLAYRLVTKNGQLNIARRTSTIFAYRRGTMPLPVDGTSSIRIVKL